MTAGCGGGDAGDAAAERPHTAEVAASCAFVVDYDGQRLPPELARLLRAPRCTTGARPVRLSGRWLGTLGTDGDTELDLDPPYDVRIGVTISSVPEYERADLMVRVPQASVGDSAARTSSPRSGAAAL